MPRVAAEIDETPGGDSFLDIVANIVGILVLLVVVVGVRAGRQPVEVPVAESTAPAPPIVADAKQAVREALLNRRDVARLIEQTEFTKGESLLRNREREELATYAATLRAELDAEREALSATDQAALDAGNDLAQAELELERLSRRQLALMGAEGQAEVEEIEIDPTPIVRSRVTNEVRLRLLEDRVVYLPLDALREELQQRGARMAARLSSTPGESSTVEEVVGPIEGFALRCLVERRMARTSEGVMRFTGLRVARLEERGQPETETVDDATREGSRLMARLATINPRETVVTIITYPDSFDVLPEFEQALRARGYRVAKALQSEGTPIEFSPSGRATVFQ